MKLNFKILFVVLGLFLSINCLLADSSLAINIKSEEFISLEKGQVLQKSISAQLKKGLKGSESKILINASAKKIWYVIDKKENLPKFIRQVEKTEIIEENNQQQKVLTRIKLCDLLPTFNYIIIFDRSEKYKRVRFKKVGGAFKELYGYFEIIPYEDKTILAYRIYSDPGFYIPEFISKSLRGNAIQVMRSIKTEAEKCRN